MAATPGKSPASRRDSVSSATGSPLRQRRTSLSVAQPPSPSLPLSATASINASMRGGSPGPASTAKDSAASRRTSVATDLALADDKLPPPAEIATGSRKSVLADADGAGSATLASRVPSISTQPTSATSPSFANRGSVSGSLSGGSPVDPFKSGALRDPMTGVAAGGDGSSPHHRRTPSVSQVHQQMEQEQEAQVNRLLVTIHQQQNLIEKLQRQLEGTGTEQVTTPTFAPSQTHEPEPDLMATQRLPSQGSSSLGVSTPTVEYPPPPTPQRAHSTSSADTTVASTVPAANAPYLAGSGSDRFSALQQQQQQHGVQQQHFFPRVASSRGSSRAASPSVRSVAGGGQPTADSDEAKYWQAEAGNLTRENDLLRARIKELEKSSGNDGAAKEGGDVAMADS